MKLRSRSNPACLDPANKVYTRFKEQFTVTTALLAYRVEGY